MTALLEKLHLRPRSPLVIACLAALALIGTVDYLTGFEVMFSVFYLLPIGVAAWFIGKGFGLAMSVLSVLVWIIGDLQAGKHYANPVVPVWNAVILAAFYFIVVWLLTSLRSLQRDLALRVKQRTEALTREMTERQRLEEQILKASEREQRAIAHDLHDNLCQHLTATALAGQVLTQTLADQSRPEAADAGHVVKLVEQGIDLARNFARGLYPVETDAEGLMAAFHDLAGNISKGAGLQCVFECESPVLIYDDAIAAHLFRIAQESVRNAIRHGKPKRIGINLSEHNGQVKLTIEDDGLGVPDNLSEKPGLGIRIMAHRAAMIGGTFVIEPAATGGTIVTCAFPKAAYQKP
ncbi:MAG: hypothetical protein C5B50_20825 [Verrucomicrobia bacterium]|nr:MAG: hypothetical protein C5B50_20825 [Verrucomicrobiota bacterium]